MLSRAQGSFTWSKQLFYDYDILFTKQVCKYAFYSAKITLILISRKMAMLVYFSVGRYVQFPKCNFSHDVRTEGKMAGCEVTIQDVVCLQVHMLVLNIICYVDGCYISVSPKLTQRGPFAGYSALVYRWQFLNTCKIKQTRGKCNAK